MKMKMNWPHGFVETIKPPCPSLHKHENDWLISVHVTTDGLLPHGLGSWLQIPFLNKYILHFKYKNEILRQGWLRRVELSGHVQIICPSKPSRQ